MFLETDKRQPVETLSPSVLAFMGDAVYGMLVREKLCEINRPSGDLHRLSVKFVSASSQSEAYKMIGDLLTEKEQAVFKRGRNFRTSNTPKSSTAAQYHTATGVEALFGYLYLSNNNRRAIELFDVIWNAQSSEALNASR